MINFTISNRQRVINPSRQASLQKMESSATIQLPHHSENKRFRAAFRLCRPESQQPTEEMVRTQYDPSNGGNGPNAAENAIQQLFANSGYPLQNVQCRVNDSELEFSGCVSKYYYVQVILRIARQFSTDRQIINNIQVVGKL